MINSPRRSVDYSKRLNELKDILRIEEKKQRIAQIQTEMSKPDFWLNDQTAAPMSQEYKNLQDEVVKFDELYELSQIASDVEMKLLDKEVGQLELLTFFGASHDDKNAIINFYTGAGGVDAQDWTEMLFNMYLRWAEKNGLGASILNETHGNEAGLKSATLEITGPYAFGKMKGESGVHRLVRQSPFNAKALRQTSFALVEVLPEIENAADVEIDQKELRIDVYRSSGHGGQSVNTTDSAVRITHLPTGIVVTCQNERSQLQNKETAMKILRSKLAKLILDQHKQTVAELKGDFSAPEWGNQIRSYVLHPYKMVKDHRTDHESKDPEGVLSGELDEFIEAEIKWLKKEQLEK